MTLILLAKLLLTSAATGLLLLHTGPIGVAAEIAAQRTLAVAELRDLRIQLLGDATAAIVVLLTATVLLVYKPKGVTPYTWRRQIEDRAA